MFKARTKIGIPDIIVCVSIAILAVLLIILPSLKNASSSVVVQTKDSTLTYSTSADRIIELESNGYSLALEIKDGAVRISDSGCPDKICVSSGWIKDPARPIVCVPAGVVVRIENDGGSTDADIIAGR